MLKFVYVYACGTYICIYVHSTYNVCACVFVLFYVGGVLTELHHLNILSFFVGKDYLGNISDIRWDITRKRG